MVTTEAMSFFIKILLLLNMYMVQVYVMYSVMYGSTVAFCFVHVSGSVHAQCHCSWYN